MLLLELPRVAGRTILAKQDASILRQPERGMLARSGGPRLRARRCRESYAVSQKGNRMAWCRLPYALLIGLALLAAGPPGAARAADDVIVDAARFPILVGRYSVFA
jgi:hypothetical protein